MRYELLGSSLLFAGLMVLWALFTGFSRLIWRALRERLVHWTAAARARGLFVLLVGPWLGAVSCTLGILLPAYLVNEPEVTEEPLRWSLLLPALLGLTALLRAVYRAGAAWRSTHRLVEGWKQDATLVHIPGVNTPIWRIQHPLPLVAVVGLVRPQMFVAAHLFTQLSAEELAAVLQHERWHLTSYDNLQRVGVDFCRLLPGGRALEQEWHESVEMTADEFAARSSPHSALDLASALVKIARLFPVGASITMPPTVSTVLLEDSSLARRVRCLMQLGGAPPLSTSRRLEKALPGAMLVLFLLLIVLTSLQPEALRAVHHGVEMIVTHLP